MLVILDAWYDLRSLANPFEGIYAWLGEHLGAEAEYVVSALAGAIAILTFVGIEWIKKAGFRVGIDGSEFGDPGGLRRGGLLNDDGVGLAVRALPVEGARTTKTGTN